MKGNSIWKYILGAAGLILLVFLVVDFNQRLEAMSRLEKQVATVRAEGTRVVLTATALWTQVAEAGSDRAAEQWAYENGQVQPGENLVQILPGGGATPTPTASATQETPDVTNWKVWWTLFFSGD